MEKVLIVEDDEGIAEFVKAELEHENFNTRIARDGRDALVQFQEFRPDAVLLDIMLPEISGLEVLRRIRRDSVIPVILVTARGETYDKVVGLDGGADDYISKPFEIEELLARLRSVLRRYNERRNTSVLFAGDLEMDVDSMEVTMCGRPIDLSKTEFALLKTLLMHKDKVLSRDDIIAEVWGEKHYIDPNSVDVYISYVRDKIGNDIISTVRGSGYVIRSVTRKF